MSRRQATRSFWKSAMRLMIGMRGPSRTRPSIGRARGRVKTRRQPGRATGGEIRSPEPAALASVAAMTGELALGLALAGLVLGAAGLWHGWRSRGAGRADAAARARVEAD